jgi:hypothetical protein
MRRAWILVGLLAASCLLMGCGGGTDTVSPEDAKAAQEALKKVDPHWELKTGKRASTNRK